MNQSLEEAWPLHSSFHPPLYAPLPPPPSPSTQRQVDPYEPSVSDAAPHTSPVWPPEIDGTVKGQEEHRVPVWDQHQQQGIAKYLPQRMFYHLLLQIYVHNAEIIKLSEQRWV